MVGWLAVWLATLALSQGRPHQRSFPPVTIILLWNLFQEFIHHWWNMKLLFRIGKRADFYGNMGLWVLWEQCSRDPIFFLFCFYCHFQLLFFSPIFPDMIIYDVCLKNSMQFQILRWMMWEDLVSVFGKLFLEYKFIILNEVLDRQQ